tara:strand:- start:1460 stop:2626 length:1167 start_codon:yes stop_codon:yes gene_type:complete
MKRIGFLINPVAGMGGRVGLKGTDGVVEEAVRRGATPVAAGRAARMLARFRQLRAEAAAPVDLRWLTCGGAMGGAALREAGFDDADILYRPRSAEQPAEQPAGKFTDRADTLAATRALVDAGADLLLFCGGDGTARDVRSAAPPRIPMLGIPSGVKMFSGVFGTTPEHTADVLHDWLDGRLAVADTRILDLDEEKYRDGEWAVRRFDTALTPVAPAFVQASKSIVSATGESAAKAGIAAFVREEYDAPGRLLLLGAGTTLEAIGRAFGIDKTLLGIDAVADGVQVGRDLDERGLLALLASWPDRRLILSPIGAQGFVIGRGNLQLGPAAIDGIGRDNIVIVATPAKIAETPVLRFDTGDPELDAALCGDGYLPVITGDGLRRRVRAVA